MEKWAKIIFGPKWTMLDRAVLLVIVSVYEQKALFIKSLDINNTLPTLISMDVANPPRRPRAATCNISRQIEIFLFVKYPLVIHTGKKVYRPPLPFTYKVTEIS